MKGGDRVCRLLARNDVAAAGLGASGGLVAAAGAVSRPKSGTGPAWCRSARRLLAAALALACAACTGGTFVRLPSFPDASCASCALDDDRRPN
jgi:hypothetical protein